MAYNYTFHKILLLLLPLSTMQFNLTKHTELKGIPSGSGIIYANDSYYIIGDDSPTLFVLNKDLDVVKRIALQDIHLEEGNRIPKPLKADYEAMELIHENELVIFGSGSKSPQRDVFVRVLLEDEPKIETYTITDFYNHLKSLEALADSELNIEATAFSNDILYLFNRNKNVVIFFRYDELLAYVQGDGSFPSIQTKHITLPKLNGIEAGFSGAVALKNEPKILFTASVENTSNAYDDGEILGSYIGMLDITKNFADNNIPYCLVEDTKEKLKVESISVINEASEGKAEVVLITDNDKGASELIKGLLLW